MDPQTQQYQTAGQPMPNQTAPVAYGAPQPMPGQQVMVVGQQQMMPVRRKEMPCCPDSEVDVSETVGLVILILNIIFGGFGTVLSSCLDRKGCNCTAYWVGVCQNLTFYCIIGWIWAILHGLAVYENSKGKI